MDQVKEGSKTMILDLKCRPNKGSDSPTPGPSTNDTNYATSSSEIGKSITSAVTKNCRTTVPYQNDSSDPPKDRENEIQFSMATEVQFSYSMKRSLVP